MPDFVSENSSHPMNQFDLKPVEVTTKKDTTRDPKKSTIRRSPSRQHTKGKGISFHRYYTEANVHPYDILKWVKKDSRIMDEKGNIIFELTDCEVPEGWSQLATDIAVSKYFRKAGVPQTGHEVSARQMVTRVARTLRKAGELQGNYFASADDAEVFEMELTHLLINQMGAFNSPVWFNCGLWHEYGISGTSVNYYWDQKTDTITEINNGYEHPQCSACFIQSVKDDMLSIFDLVKNEAKLFKYGSGTGTNFSSLRGRGEKLSGGGTSSGVMSFLEVLDRGAASIKSGGTTRRAAKMVILDIDHPEIVDFILWKVREEKKAQILIASGEYPSDYNGEAYKTVSGQNSNNSVRVTDAFMDAFLNDQEWNTISRTSGEKMNTYQAREIMEMIAQSAWSCADPGIQFDTTINTWHMVPNSGRINGSNPCSEYMFLDDSACNLASLNLMKYMHDGTFDIAGYRHGVEVFLTAMDIIIDFASYPTAQIAGNSHTFRPLGLGYANLGTLLMTMGIPYDSEEGRAWAGALTAMLHSRAYAHSAELAHEKEPFSEYDLNKEPALHVIQKHRDAAFSINTQKAPQYIIDGAREDADRMLALAQKYGVRNAQVTNIAPTGTIGLLMDCDTTGVEPDFGLVKFKKLAGGGFFKIVNQSVREALHNVGYTDIQIDAIITYAVGTGTLAGAPHINEETLREKGFTDADIHAINEKLPGSFDLEHALTHDAISAETFQRLGVSSEQLEDTSFRLLVHLGFSEDEIEEASKVICGVMMVEGAPDLNKEHLAIFDCANKCGKYGTRSIAAMGHVRMMAAVQPFISGAISKTVNLPFEATAEEIKQTYIEAWRLGVKAIAVYRDGSKGSQPLSSGTTQKKKEYVEKEVETKIEYRPMRRRLADERSALTHKFSIAGHKGFVTVGLYDDGTPGEIFITMSKEGTVISGLLDAFATSISFALQYGVPLRDLVNKFAHMRFEPSGFTKNIQIPIAKSIVDYIFRWMAVKFLPRDDWAGVGIHVDESQLQEMETPSATPPTSHIDDTTQPQLSLDTPPANTHRIIHSSRPFDVTGDSPTCDSCGGLMTRSGTCYKCMNCGSTSGCS